MLPGAWLRSRWARQLSRRGEHAAALALCDAGDVCVLSRAGMHLSVLELARRDSIERAIALAHLGEADEALHIARACPPHRESDALIGMIAALAPAEASRLAGGQARLRNVRAYCESALGQPGYARENAASLSPLHALDAEIAAGGFSDAARAQFRRVFAEAGLEVPEHRGEAGIDLRRLQLEPGSPCLPDRRALVSVILTAYNEERLLTMAVRSVLRQDWENLELLIVDDGSIDGTWEVAQRLARSDSRIKLLRCESNSGTWRAKNLALQVARGEFITMHDADDWSHPAKLRLQVMPMLTDARIQCTSSYFFRVGETTGRPFTRNAGSFLRWNVSSLMFRSQLLRDVGVYHEGLLGGDCEFAARIELFKGVGTHLKIRKPLAIGLQRENSLSNVKRHREDGRVRLQHWESWRLEHMRVCRNPEEAWSNSQRAPGTRLV